MLLYGFLGRDDLAQDSLNYGQGIGIVYRYRYSTDACCLKFCAFGGGTFCRDGIGLAQENILLLLQ